MSLAKKLNEDMKTAMKARDQLRLSVIRMLRAEIRNEEIKQGKPIDDDGVLVLVGREIKKRKEAVIGFSKGKRDDLVKKEEAEMAVLYGYLPPQAEDDEIITVIRQVIDSLPEGGGTCHGRHHAKGHCGFQGSCRRQAHQRTG